MVSRDDTYSEIPVFKDLFAMPHNSYDKPGHLDQGFVLANVALLTLWRLHDRHDRNQSGRDDDIDGLPVNRRSLS